VTIEGDTVILTGRVRSWVEKREAERVAWSAPGVVAVDNRIVVG
jgi:osmotically-inducible protein OsmY